MKVRKKETEKEQDRAMGANTSQDQMAQPSDHTTDTSSKPQDMTARKVIEIAANRDHVSDTSNKPKETAGKKVIETVVAAVEEVKLPHNFAAIAKMADSPLDSSSLTSLHAGVFLNQKKKKYWIAERTKRNCFFVYARDLSITWSDDNRYWHWPNLKDISTSSTSEDSVDVAELFNVCWLEVHGTIEIEMLTPDVTYQVSYVVMLKDPAYGWDLPVNFRLTLPDGSIQHHKENLMEIPRGRWIEIPVGKFKTSASPQLAGKMEFSMYEYEGGKWKKGLAIKGVVIQPLK